MNNEELNMYKELIMHKRNGGMEHCFGQMCDSLPFCPVCKDYEPCKPVTENYLKEQAEEHRRQMQELSRSERTLLERLKDAVKGKF